MSLVNDMQVAFYQHTFQRYEIVAPNIYLDWRFNEMDIFALRKGSGYVDEVEIKTSRSDYLADFKKTVSVKGEIVTKSWGENQTYNEKPKHEALNDGLNPCNYFSFLLPETLEEKCEVPEYAGLYVYRVDNAGVGRVSEVKKAPLLHKRKIDENMKFNVGRKMAYRYWRMSA